MKKILILLLITIIAVSLAAMGIGCKEEVAPAEEEAEVAPAEEEKVTLVVMGRDDFKANPDDPFFQEKLKAFNEAYPNIEIQAILTKHPNYNPKVVSMQAAGEQLDIVWGDNTELKNFASAGLLIDHKPLIEASEIINEDDYSPALIDSLYFNGELIAIPSDIALNVVYYNKDLFDAAGVDYPEVGWTWDNFLEKAKKLTKTEGLDPEDQVWGFSLTSAWWVQWLTTAASFGALPLFSEDGKEAYFNSPEFVEAMQFFTDLVNVHKVSPPPGMDVGKIGVSFDTGKMAMILDGTWAFVHTAGVYTPKWDFNWGIVTPPTGKVLASELFQGSWTITKSCENVDAAFKFLEFTASLEGQKLVTDVDAMMPAHLQVIEENYGAGFFDKDAISVILESYNACFAVTWSTRTFDAYDIVQATIDLIMNNPGMDVQKAFDEANEEINELLQEE